jgi:DNA-binding NarL/FixJ family response regulator
VHDAPARGYGCAVDEPIRVVVGEDDVLLREGIVRLLGEAGFEVLGQAGDADDFLRKALAHRPDVAVVDIQMPPGHGDDGLRSSYVSSGRGSACWSSRSSTRSTTRWT